MIREVDLDGEGEIDYQEFLNLMAREMQEKMIDEELIEAFKSFGANNE